jgi:hypothetical protein
MAGLGKYTSAALLCFLFIHYPHGFIHPLLGIPILVRSIGAADHDHYWLLIYISKYISYYLCIPHYGYGVYSSLEEREGCPTI